MIRPIPMSGLLRFGDFELDLSAYSMRRRGESVKLEKLPMEVLILLVTRAGALVDRSEIKAALWGADVFVEHDAAINTAIRKIRQALDDDADTPRFVETVVGKGYRFVAPVENVSREHHLETRLRSDRGRRTAALIAASVAIAAGVLWLAREMTPAVGVTAKSEANSVSPLARRPVLPAAYDAYVRGRHAWDKRSEADLREAIRYFQESIDADPTYAPAYAGLADAYGQLGYGSYVAPQDSFPRARAAAVRALELDATLAEAHASLGYSSMYYDWDFAKAEAEYKRAIELNPDYAIAHQWYAYLLTALERPASEAEREIAIARKLDPLSVPINIDHAYILHYYQRNAEALHSVSLALEMNPKHPLAYFWLGRIYMSDGRYDQAELALQKVGPLRTWTPAMAVLGYLYGKTGREKKAREILAEFDDLVRKGRYASGYAVAVIYAGLGDRDRAFSSLEAAYRERTHWLIWLKRDPRWNDIRSDARFRDLVRRVGLPS